MRISISVIDIALIDLDTPSINGSVHDAKASSVGLLFGTQREVINAR